MRGHSRKQIGVAVLVLASSMTPFAEVYQWKDESGKLHFGDKAPEKTAAQAIGKNLAVVNIDQASKNSSAVTAPPTQKTEDEKQLEIKEKRKLQDAIGPACAEMKKDMESIARGDRGVFRDADGRDENVLEKDRGKKLAEWQERYQDMGCEMLEKN